MSSKNAPCPVATGEKEGDTLKEWVWFRKETDTKHSRNELSKEQFREDIWNLCASYHIPEKTGDLPQKMKSQEILKR